MKEFNLTSPYFVYVGNAYPHKNLARLIKAVVLLNKQSPVNVSLAIASSRNVFTQRLEKLVKLHEAGSFVKLLGFVPDEKLKTLYQNSIAFVFPSLSEGFGLPGLEAMSAGTLVLASEIPVFKEIYQDNAIFFDPLDVSKIANTMGQAIKMDKNKRREKISQAQNFAKRYSWHTMAQETLKIYKEVYGNKNRSISVV